MKKITWHWKWEVVTLDNYALGSDQGDVTHG
jgi:hypothetical protein